MLCLRPLPSSPPRWWGTQWGLLELLGALEPGAGTWSIFSVSNQGGLDKKSSCLCVWGLSTSLFAWAWGLAGCKLARLQAVRGSAARGEASFSPGANGSVASLESICGAVLHAGLSSAPLDRGVTPVGPTGAACQPPALPAQGQHGGLE